MGKDDQCSGENPSTSQSSNCASNDKCIRGRGSTANQRSKFKDPDSRQKSPLQAEKGVDPAVNQLESTNLHEKPVSFDCSWGGGGFELTVNM